MRRPLVLTIVLFAVVAVLCWRFPYAIRGEGDKHHLMYLMLLLVVMIFSGRMSRDRFPHFVRDALLWVGVIVALVFAYSFRDSFSHRMMGELMPQQAQERGNGTIEVHASEGGHFFIEAKVNDAYVRFMVDTGATDIVLSPADAERAGISLAALSYDRASNTANGYGSGAGVTLDHLSIGSLHMSHLSATVNKADMDTSLLGMSFLKRLQGFRVEGSTLVLIP